MTTAFITIVIIYRSVSSFEALLPESITAPVPLHSLGEPYQLNVSQICLQHKGCWMNSWSALAFLIKKVSLEGEG